MKRFRRFLLQIILPLLLLSLLPLSPVSARAVSRAVAHPSQHIVVMPTNFQHRISPATSSDLYYHGGPVMETPTVHVIFWGASWLSNGRLIKAGRIASHFFQDAPATSYFNILTQYYDGGGAIHNQLNFDSVIDTSNPPTDSNCQGIYPNSTVEDASLQAEIAAQIQAQHWQVNNSTSFFIYPPPTDFVHNTFGCSEQQYCAYHGTGNGIGSYGAIAFPFSSACQGLPQSPHGDIFSDSLVNVTSHELFESISDPLLNAWYGSGGLSDEIGDKCAYNFSGGLTFLNNGGVYEVQTEFSNAVHSCTNHNP